MLKTYFGELSTGRLQRLPYLGYSLLIVAIIFAVMFGTVSAIVGAEVFLGGNLVDAQAMIMNALGIPFTIILMIIVLALMFAGLVLFIKRVRDMGLPVLMTIVALFVVSALVNWLFGQTANQLVSLAVTLGLLFIPSNTFAERKE